ncbi:MAG TPA: hypothetical protein VJS44_04950 [Pyrinomonadaceae bacterium]|nr:hypothetical protein [Pyrinomonadaceae bacterium]
MLRRYKYFAPALMLLALSLTQSYGVAEGQTTGNTQPQQSGSQKTDEKKVTVPKSNVEVNAEQVAEAVVYAYGSRGALEQIRRNGVERGRLTRIGTDGRTEEASYERRFIRGTSAEKDKVRLDQKLPTIEYSLLYGEGRLWGIINGSAFTPREDATIEFQSLLWHGLDALLRYKENGSTLSLGGKDKQNGVEFYIVDVTDKEKRSTRYYISTRTLRVMWLEYETPATAGGTPVKYMRRFYDYRSAQGTLVPFRTVFFEDGKQSQETRIMTVTYGVKMEESLFQNPDASQRTSASN